MAETFESGDDKRALREAFLRDGVVVVQGVVPAVQCEAVIAATDRFVAANPSHADRQVGHGIVPLHHAQSLWDVRTLPAIHDAFSAVHDTPELLVSVDRVSTKPAHAGAAQKRSPIHWDCDPFSFHGMGTQGVVYLTDTTEAQGPFCCVPSIYRNLASYRRQYADVADRRRPRFDEEDVLRVPGKRGSLVIFHRLMPHSSEVNQGDMPRYAQYVAMGPVSEQARESTAQLWRARMPPPWAVQQKVPGQQMPEPGAATLTDLGERLAGVRPW